MSGEENGVTESKLGVPDKRPKMIKMRIENYLLQWSSTFLAPGTGFVEDNFSLGVGDGGGDEWLYILPPDAVNLSLATH